MFLRFLISLILGIAAGKVFHFFFFYFFDSYVISILVGILAYYLIYRSLKYIVTRKGSKTVLNDPFKAVASEKAVREGMAKLKNLRSNTRMILNNGVASKVVDICKTGAEIFDYLSKNPEDISKARQFINYYLDATEKIVNQYIELAARKDKTKEIENSLNRVEAMLDSIKDTYSKQLHNLLEDDLLDLNTEISVLEKTMKYEG
jgi:5-bromo-4-chloroindolyl phosphate hydrolysis protein